METLNKYGEPIGQIIVGVSVGELTYRSKNHTWKIRLKSESDSPYTEIDSVYVTLQDNSLNPVTEYIPIRKKPARDYLAPRTPSEFDISINDEIDEELLINSETAPENPSFLKKGPE